MLPIGVVAAAIFIAAVALASVGSVLGAKYLPHPWNIVAPLLLAFVAGLVGAGATWLVDRVRRRRQERAARPTADPVERTFAS